MPPVGRHQPRRWESTTAQGRFSSVPPVSDLRRRQAPTAALARLGAPPAGFPGPWPAGPFRARTAAQGAAEGRTGGLPPAPRVTAPPAPAGVTAVLGRSGALALPRQSPPAGVPEPVGLTVPPMSSSRRSPAPLAGGRRRARDRRRCLAGARFRRLRARAKPSQPHPAARFRRPARKHGAGAHGTGPADRRLVARGAAGTGFADCPPRGAVPSGPPPSLPSVPERPRRPRRSHRRRFRSRPCRAGLRIRPSPEGGRRRDTEGQRRDTEGHGRAKTTACVVQCRRDGPSRTRRFLPGDGGRRTASAPVRRA